jgi:hypothetical protein
MTKYRKKPVVIEAVQWFEGDQVEGVQDLAMLSEMYFSKSAADGRYVVKTLEGMMQVSPGDWIITGVKGEKYPCKPDIFELTYEPAEPTPPVQPDIKPGDNVEHKHRPEWGIGTVMAAADNALVFFNARNFDDQLTECEFTELEVITDDQPTKEA